MTMSSKLPGVILLFFYGKKINFNSSGFVGVLIIIVFPIFNLI